MFVSCCCGSFVGLLAVLVYCYVRCLLVCDFGLVFVDCFVKRTVSYVVYGLLCVLLFGCLVCGFRRGVFLWLF